MGTNPNDPVVLIRSNPQERVDREVGLRVKERIKRIRTGPHPTVLSRNKTQPEAPAEPDDPARESAPQL